MARILHVEDDDEWINYVQRALADHRVDSAKSYEAALSLISGNVPYDVALVDLNLQENADRLGGEVLDLLMADYPATRRIVVTGRPPTGGMRTNILRRYAADEIILKGDTTLPDLRKAIAEALAHLATGQADGQGLDRTKSSAESRRPATGEAGRRAVMVIYGHDREANSALFDWLRAIGLLPQEWTQLVEQTDQASPYTGQILERALSAVQAVIAYFTPDEYVIDATSQVGPPARWRRQARPNVILETGMALAVNPDRTILVLLGSQDLPSDIAGRHFIRLNGTAASLHELANRLHDAGCEVQRSGSHWLDPARFPSRESMPSSPSHDLLTPPA